MAFRFLKSMQSPSQPEPRRDRVSGTDKVHACSLETLKGLVGLLGVIDHSRYHHRRGAILEQVNFLRQLWIVGLYLAEQIFHGPGHTMALRLPGDDHDIVFFHAFQKTGVLAGELLARWTVEHFM